MDFREGGTAEQVDLKGGQQAEAWGSLSLLKHSCPKPEPQRAPQPATTAPGTLKLPAASPQILDLPSPKGSFLALSHSMAP